MIHHIRRSSRLALPLEQVFPFFADAGNLSRLTPAELRFRFITPLPIEMRVGAIIEYRLRLFGIPFGWRTRVDEWEPNRGFVDRQVHGPFGRWVHTHRFRSVDGETEMEDDVEWALPLQPVGELARPIVAAQLERIFDYRAQAMHEALLGDEARQA